MSDRLDRMPLVVDLTTMLAQLGEEWRESILSALKGRRLKLEKCVFKSLDPHHHPLNLDWDLSTIETKAVREWLAGLPSFTGPLKGAPPLLTKAALLAPKRLGPQWKAALERACSDQPPLWKSPFWFNNEQIIRDLYETADVEKWLARVTPGLVAPSPAVAATVLAPDLKDSTPKPKNPPAPYVTVRIEIPIQKSADGLVETTPSRIPVTAMYDTPTELAGLLEESTPSTERPLKQERRIQVILAELDRQTIPRQAIPRGCKKKLQNQLCQSSPQLFTKDTFLKAWSAALKDKKLLTIDHDKHSPRN